MPHVAASDLVCTVCKSHKKAARPIWVKGNNILLMGSYSFLNCSPFKDVVSLTLTMHFCTNVSFQFIKHRFQHTKDARPFIGYCVTKFIIIFSCLILGIFYTAN